MFNNIYYDNSNGKISLWETEDEHRSKIEETPAIEYYVPDQTKKSSIKDIYGNVVVLQTSKTIHDMKYVASSVSTCETDVAMDIKYLQKRYLGKDLIANMKNFNVATIDIEVEADGSFPDEWETKYPINLISIHFSKTNELYTFGNKPYTGNSSEVKNYHYCADEKTLIEKFIIFFRKQKVDIITGWYCRTFDIPYIVNRCKMLGIEKTLSPLNIVHEKHINGYHVSGKGYMIAGISILDGVELYKNFVYKKRESYSLQSIGMLEVKEGKKSYEGTINNVWKIDWNGFVEYNVQDVLLSKKIEDKKKHIELTINFCYQALIPFEKIFSSISLITGYILRYLHNKNIVYPDRSSKQEKDKKFPGAFVMAQPGFYKYIVSFDVESMYPHIIKMYNISPETIKINPIDPENYNKCPLSDTKTWETTEGNITIGGIYYKKEKGILPEIVTDIFNERKQFKIKKEVARCLETGEILEEWQKKFVEGIQLELEKSEYYNSQQLIRKILINSIYGVLGNPYFNFFNVNNAMAVTLGGQELIKYLSNSMNSYMKDNWYKIIDKCFPNKYNIIKKPLEKDVVILIDTDSNYLCLEEIIKNLNINFEHNKDFADFVNKLNDKFFKPFFKKILDIYAEKYGVQNVINFKKEKTITQKFILAKKKYADEVIEDDDGTYYDDPEISITGIEIVRTDTPSFCRSKIKEVIKNIFRTKAQNKSIIIDEMREIHEKFLTTSLDEIAVPKGVTDYKKYAQPIEYYFEHGLSYPKSCPIHVRASINYNFIIKKFNLPLQPIDNGTKMKFVYVADQKNILNQNIIGFVNNWPKEFDKMFKLDMDAQWDRVFQSVIQRFFDVLQWGNIRLEKCGLSSLFE